jgi:urease accessory protein
MRFPAITTPLSVVMPGEGGAASTPLPAAPVEPRADLKMRQATEWHRGGDWPEAHAAGTVTLSYADRCKRRIQMKDDAGGPFLLNLQRAVRLADGDGLRMNDGGYLRIVAAPEPLVEATATDGEHLAKLAWHIGNRHVPAEIVQGRLRIAADRVLENMLQLLGAATRRVDAPFHPEGGAYGQLDVPASHGHAHHHGH